MFVVFDFDGTLSDDRHRRPLLPPAEGGCYAAYHAACASDPPITAVLRTLVAHLSAGHRVEIWTGRSKSEEAKSRGWLAMHVRDLGYLGGVHEIKMRMRESEGSVIELKRRWLLDLPLCARPRLVYDDRADVVAMFRSHDVACAQVVAP